jgi:hypothetical protein
VRCSGLHVSLAELERTLEHRILGFGVRLPQAFARRVPQQETPPAEAEWNGQTDDGLTLAWTRQRALVLGDQGRVRQDAGDRNFCASTQPLRSGDGRIRTLSADAACGRAFIERLDRVSGMHRTQQQTQL